MLAVMRAADTLLEWQKSDLGTNVYRFDAYTPDCLWVFVGRMQLVVFLFYGNIILNQKS